MASPVWYIVDTTHPSFPSARGIARVQHEQFGRGLLSITYNQAGDRAIIKVLETSPAWRNGTPFEAVPDLVQTVLDPASHLAFARGEWRTAEWIDPNVTNP